MGTVTVDEAREALVEAERHYLTIEAAIKETRPGLSPPERVLQNIERRAEFEEAARVLIDAKAQYEKIQTETNERLRAEAEEKLAGVVDDLSIAVERAELAMTALFNELDIVISLSKERYAHMVTARGRAPRSVLARAQTAGWIRHGLSRLELADLGRAERHHRDRLGNLLGLDNQTNDFDTTDGGDR